MNAIYKTLEYVFSGIVKLLVKLITFLHPDAECQSSRQNRRNWHALAFSKRPKRRREPCGQPRSDGKIQHRSAPGILGDTANMCQRLEYQTRFNRLRMGPANFQAVTAQLTGGACTANKTSGSR